MHSDLEAYRNSILSVTDSFSILFKTLNNVFGLNTHFNFVQSKLNAVIIFTKAYMMKNETN